MMKNKQSPQDRTESQAKDASASAPGKDDVHEQREQDQPVEGVVHRGKPTTKVRTPQRKPS